MSAITELTQDERKEEQTAGSFERDGYVVTREVFNQQSLDIYSSYALMLGAKCFHRREDKFGFRDRYGDPLMESILLHLKPAMEQITGLSLLPTYSFLRIYETGAVLTRHTDRSACEISASVTLGYDAPQLWPIWLQTRQEPRSITLHPGDMLVYKGRELPHWRERFDGNYWIQVFFHYVDSDGPLAAYKFDGRDALGLPPK